MKIVISDRETYTIDLKNDDTLTLQEFSELMARLSNFNKFFAKDLILTLPQTETVKEEEEETNSSRILPPRLSKDDLIAIAKIRYSPTLTEKEKVQEARKINKFITSHFLFKLLYKRLEVLGIKRKDILAMNFKTTTGGFTKSKGFDINRSFNNKEDAKRFLGFYSPLNSKQKDEYASKFNKTRNYLNYRAFQAREKLKESEK